MFSVGIIVTALKNLLEVSRFAEFANLEFLAKQIVEGFITGLHRSPFHGFSVEFAEHRLYNTGESTKHIDWKLYARTEKVFVKRYEEETNLRCQLIIDNSSSMFFPLSKEGRANKLSFAVVCAAALNFLLRVQRDACGLTVFSDQIELQTDARLSSVHQQRIFRELEGLLTAENQVLNKKTRASALLHQIAESLHKRSLVVIFSDMLESENADDLFHALQHFRHNQHEVILFHITDQDKEIDFGFRNQPHRFIDMETGTEMRVNPNNVRDYYIEALKKYFAELKLRCAQYRIDLVEAFIQKDFRQVLLPYLLKRERLY